MEHRAVQARLQSAYTKHALNPAAATIPGVVDDSKETRAERVARLVKKCRPAKEWAETAYEKPPWAIDRLLVFGAMTDIHSPPKEGKTTALAYMVKALVNGSEVFGRAAVKTPVVWVTEQPRSSFEPEVLQKVGLQDAADLFLLYFHDIFEASWEDRAEAAITAANKHGARVVIFDTLAELAGIEGEQENQSGPMLKALKPLTPALEAGMAIVIVQHDRKTGGGAVSGVRGSSAIPGKVDALFQLTTPGGQHGPNVRRISYKGRYGAIPAEMLIELTEDGYALLGTEREVAAQRHQAQRLGDWLLLASVAPERRSERISGRALAERLQGRIGDNKVVTRLAGYRARVQRGDEPEAGMFLWDGEDGRGGYWKACACRLRPNLSASGTVDALSLVVDPECDGDHGGDDPMPRVPLPPGIRGRGGIAPKPQTSRKNIVRGQTSESSGDEGKPLLPLPLNHRGRGTRGTGARRGGNQRTTTRRSA